MLPNMLTIRNRDNYLHALLQPTNTSLLGHYDNNDIDRERQRRTSCHLFLFLS